MNIIKQLAPEVVYTLDRVYTVPPEVARTIGVLSIMFLSVPLIKLLGGDGVQPPWAAVYLHTTASSTINSNGRDDMAFYIRQGHPSTTYFSRFVYVSKRILVIV